MRFKKNKKNKNSYSLTVDYVKNILGAPIESTDTFYFDHDTLKSIRASFERIHGGYDSACFYIGPTAFELKKIAGVSAWISFRSGPYPAHTRVRNTLRVLQDIESTIKPTESTVKPIESTAAKAKATVKPIESTATKAKATGKARPKTRTKRTSRRAKK